MNLPMLELIRKYLFPNHLLMRSHHFILLCNIFVTFSLITFPTLESAAPARTLITHKKNSGGPWIVHSDQGFIISHPHDNQKRKHTASPSLSIGLENGRIIINKNNTNATHLRITPVNGTLSLMGQSFSGSVLVTVENQRFTLAHCPDFSAQHDTIKRREKEAAAKKRKKEKKKKEPVIQRDRVQIKESVVEHQEQQEQPEEIIAPEESAFTVRVLLDEADLHAPTEWKISSPEGFMVVDAHNTAVRTPHDARALSITHRQGAHHVNGQRFNKEHLYIMPQGKTLICNGTEYCGSILVTVHNNKRMLINCIDLETYVYCVLRTESWPGWPLEINKVFAIACRTYAVAMVTRSSLAKIPYHIKNTNAHQTYQGHNTNDVHRQAVEETKGIFIAHNNKPITAMFDGCCGGIIPAHVKGINFNDAPYLKRPYACTYCKTAKVYSWETDIHLKDLHAMIKKEAPSLRKIKSLRIAKKDQAGLVEQIHIKDIKRNITLSGKKFYAMFKDVKSFCFSITRDGDVFTFKGRGRGHHMGLCQWGAREMVRLGKPHREILEFYYPGTTFMRLS